MRTDDPDLVRTIVARPELEVRQQTDGTLFVGGGYHGERTLTELAGTADDAVARVLAHFPVGAGVQVLSAEIGWRPMPDDGEPIIGAAPGTPGLHLAVMHSAVTLAAAVGRLAADEIISGASAPELAGCRFARFDG